MKKTLLVLLFLPAFLLAQVPQGVGYQGVATDANGIELVNQSISIRASVLSGSANGTVEWEETHATSTDTFGLFSLTIGQGTSTGNGAQLSFADISWGTNTHYLKIEIDVTGGANYSFMGTNQMMSVPYALYAESANINYDSISNLLSNDSTFITNIGGGLGGGCDWRFPDGLDGDPIIWHLPGNDYTVPSGKNLYITSMSGYNSGDYMQIDGIEIMYNNNFAEIIIVGPGSVVSTNSITSAEWANFNGILVDANVEPIIWHLPGNDYTVPSGKNLYITSMSGYNSGDYMQIDGIEIMYNNNFAEIIIVGPGSVVSTNSITSYEWANFNGYLVDENYFAGCGGGSSNTGNDQVEGNDFLDDIPSSDFDPSDDIDQIPQNLDGTRIILFSTEKTIYLTDSVGSFLSPLYSVEDDLIGCLTSNDNGDTLYFLQCSHTNSNPVIMMMTINNLNPIAVGSVPFPYSDIRQFKYFNGDFYYLNSSSSIFKISNGTPSLVDNSDNYSVTVSNSGTVYRGYNSGGWGYISNSAFGPYSSDLYDLYYSDSEDRMYIYDYIGAGQISYWDFSNNSQTLLFSSNYEYQNGTSYKEQVIFYDGSHVYFNLKMSLFSVDNTGNNLRIITSSTDDRIINGIVSLIFQYQNVNPNINTSFNVDNYIASNNKKIFFSTEKTIYLTDSVGSFLSPLYSVEDDLIGCLTSNDNGDTLYFLQCSHTNSNPVIMMMTINNLNPIAVGSVPFPYSDIRQFKYFNGDFYYLNSSSSIFKISNGTPSLVDNSDNYSVTVSNSGTVYRGYNSGGWGYISNSAFGPYSSDLYDLYYSDSEDRMYIYDYIGAGQISYWDFSNNSQTLLFSSNYEYQNGTSYKEQVIFYDGSHVYFNLKMSLFSVDNTGNNLRIVTSSTDDRIINGIVISD